MMKVKRMTDQEKMACVWWAIIVGSLAFWILGAIGVCNVGPSFGQAKIVGAIWDMNDEPDLAGYRLYWTQEPDVYDPEKSFEILIGDFVESPGLNSINTGWLAAGTWHFAATAFDLSGNESEFSDPASFDVPDVAPGTPKTIEWRLTLPDGTEMTVIVTTP